jgi:hypothetical protein
MHKNERRQMLVPTFYSNPTTSTRLLLPALTRVEDIGPRSRASEGPTDSAKCKMQIECEQDMQMSSKMTISKYFVSLLSGIE